MRIDAQDAEQPASEPDPGKSNFPSRQPPGRSNRFPIGKRALKIYAILAGLVLLVNVISFLFKDHILSAFELVYDHVDKNWFSARDKVSDDGKADLFKDFETGSFEPFETVRTNFKIISPLILQPPYKVIASDRFWSKDTLVVLANIRGIGGTDICFTDDQRKFPCGLMGRASLQNQISREPLRCVAVFYEGHENRFKCSLHNGTDLAAHQVAAGFALPDSFGQLSLGEPLEAAQKQRAGAWQGAWTVVPLSELDRLRRIPTKPGESRNGSLDDGAGTASPKQ